MLLFCIRKLHKVSRNRVKRMSKILDWDGDMNDIGACDKTAYGWPSISPEGQPDDATVYTQVKSEFSLDDDMFDIDKHQQQSRADDVMFAKPKAVPTATSDAAAASLQTAFCKKPSMKANDTISFNGINDAVKTEAGEEIYGAFGTTPFVNTPATTNTTCVAAENSSVTCQNSNACVDAQQMDIYRDLILRHLIQDISTTCAKLGLPTAFESYHQQQQAGGQSNGGITAADNSMPKNNWMTAGGQTTMIGPEPMKNNVGRPDFVQQYHPTELHQQHYFNNGAIGNGVQDGHAFFGNGVLPSPSDSDRSSNASMHDMADDECIDLQSMLQMQQDGMRFCSQMNGMEMANTQTPPTEEQRPSPFPRHSGTVHLWHFIRELLDHPNKQYGSCVRWVDRDEGTFKIESSHHLARFWGQRKNRAQMNYDKLSRSLRQYYKKGL
nr:unnamed protein product [Haemonchus contortus]